MALVTIDALYLGRQWAQNLLLFAVWLFAILSTVAVFSKETQAIINKKGFSVPQSVSMAYDLLFIAVLASYGWFFSAAAWTWQMLCEVSMRKKKEEGRI
jgi:hypothetical protein